MPRRANPEDQIQRAILDYLQVALPETLVFAVPNGGKRGKAEAGRLKAQGVLAGVSDLVIVLPEGRTAFVEVKAAKGRVSEDQTDFLRRALGLGHLIAIVRSVDDMAARLELWGVETKARVG